MIAAEPGKKRRQCGPKTRTGCQTCKIRRVKCDESKPSCKRCTSTGRKCDGYVQGSIPSPDDKDFGAVIQRIATHLPGSSQEKRGFQYFVTTTSAELSGFFTNSFWEHLILQASATDPSLRHAVVAIGSIHEEFAHNRLSYDVESESKGQAFAISQYTKAISHLRRSLLNGKQAPITALMSCILFACFDSLRGYFDNAMIHLQSGLKILKDFKAQSAEDAHMVETHITPLFMRLSIQAILYIDTRTTSERKDLVNEMAEICARETEVPEIFESLEDARKHMNQSAHGLFRMFHICDGTKPMQDQPPEAKRMFLQYTRQMTAWNKSFEKFMAAKSHTFNSKQLRGAALLKIHQLVSTVMRDVTPDDRDARPVSESVNDPNNFRRYESDFRIVVNLARSLIVAAEQDKMMGKSPLTFSTDLGLVGPLYYTCIRCTEPTVKMQALELLLQLPRREGMWDSESTVKMIKEYWEIERRHEQLQKATGELATPVPLVEVIDLVFGDGMRWEWKWKHPLGKMPVMLKNGEGSEVISTFSDDWKDLLEDQSWFTEDFTMATGYSPLTDGSIFGTESMFGMDGAGSLGIESPAFGTPASFGVDSTFAFKNEDSVSPGAPELMQWVVPTIVPDTRNDYEWSEL
ncbi:uncharacterized protein LY89DRAFT_778534 [Mollisia scopiformis]|uniref:Zn(2)-C6 fungal-type domain-containing protein n=1 Tax=Mollisia scopiformis TaxID=149040 RepID=A0A194XKX5_MOLSC|nr:uncharacterized protein LY89DRAFT_778534 [Mollisia scopiformis]KUJ20885.1 hypothetical protein LY89DRAFT_778534 [Mollisia scopiformis]